MKEVCVRDDHQSKDNHKRNRLKASQILSEHKARGSMGAGKDEVPDYQSQYTGPLDLMSSNQPSGLPTLQSANVKVSGERLADTTLHFHHEAWRDVKIVQHHCLIVHSWGPEHFMRRLWSDMARQSRSPGSQLPEHHTVPKASIPACLWILH